MYKLIALDIDGTTVNAKHEITERTKSAIAKARAKGVLVMLCTGRPIHGIRNYLEELDMNQEGDYSITFNGALIQDNFTGEVLVDLPLSEKEMHVLQELADELQLLTHYSDVKSIYTNHPVMPPYAVMESYITTAPLQYVERSKGFVGCSKFMISAEEDAFNKGYGAFPDEIHQNFMLTRTAPYWVEITNKKASKGLAIAALIEKLGIKQQEVIAIGDQLNDASMIEFAGLGVAMGNAVDGIKNIANYITLDVEEDGVAHVIEKFVLEENDV